MSVVLVRKKVRTETNTAVTDRDSKAGSHPVQIVGVGSHSHDLGDDGLAGPFDSKHLRQLLEVDSGSFPDAVYVVSQPGHAKVSKLFIEEGFSELGREEGYIFDDSLTHTP